MKNLLILLTVSLVWMNSAVPHGLGGDTYEPEDESDISQAQRTSPNSKSFEGSALEQDVRWWGATLSTGWTSREMHYGVDETGNFGAYTTQLDLRIKGLTLSVWSGFGTGNEYQEWDFTIAYFQQLGPVFFVPGYNFRYQPGIVEEDHDEPAHDDHKHHEESEPHDDAGHSHSGHSHNTYGNELFFVLGTTAIPYVTPSALFVCDLNNTPGSYMEVRLDGAIPLYRDVLKLQPYALLGLNFGYNTDGCYGWNNFQFGLKSTWKINRIVSIFGSVNYSVALTALEEIDQGNEVWASAGVTFTY
ncbi:MAG: hypothetical protein WBX20_08795 [Terrimicrobiaceae bacterium]